MEVESLSLRRSTSSFTSVGPGNISSENFRNLTLASVDVGAFSKDKIGRFSSCDDDDDDDDDDVQ